MVRFDDVLFHVLVVVVVEGIAPGDVVVEFTFFEDCDCLFVEFEVGEEPAENVVTVP